VSNATPPESDSVTASADTAPDSDATTRTSGTVDRAGASSSVDSRASGSVDGPASAGSCSDGELGGSGAVEISVGSPISMSCTDGAGGRRSGVMPWTVIGGVSVGGGSASSASPGWVGVISFVVAVGAVGAPAWIWVRALGSSSGSIGTSTPPISVGDDDGPVCSTGTAVIVADCGPRASGSGGPGGDAATIVSDAGPGAIAAAGTTAVMDSDGPDAGAGPAAGRSPRSRSGCGVARGVIAGGSAARSAASAWASTIGSGAVDARGALAVRGATPRPGGFVIGFARAPAIGGSDDRDPARVGGAASGGSGGPSAETSPIATH